MHGVTFRVDGGGPLAAASADHDAVADLWCDDHCDLLRVRGRDAAALLDAARPDLPIRDELAGDGECVAVTDCLADDVVAVDPLVAAHDCVLVPPLSYVDGDRLLRVLALDGDRLAGLYADLREEWSVEVVRKDSAVDASAAMPGSSGGDTLESLSDRQREALTLAVEGGYYELPRETTTAAIGEAMGIDRRTAEEHLRRAERGVVGTVFGREGRNR